MWGRLAGLLSKEFTHFLRDPVMLFVVVFLYTAELVMCTLALGFDVQNLKLGVIDHDRSEASRALVRELTSGDNFVLIDQFTAMGQAQGRLQRGALDVVVEVPPNFAARVAAGRQVAIGVVVDGSNGNVAARARAYVIEQSARFAQSRAPPGRAIPPGVQPEVRVWYNPDLTNTRFMALSMMAQAGLMLGVVLPAAAMVREKQGGTIEQLRVTPTRAHELFIAKVTPTIVICTGAVFPALLIMTLMGVPMRGDVMTLLALTVVFLLSAVSLGVFVGTITDTLQQAMLLSFFGLFPLMFLSGTIAPIETMPGWLQTASLASPQRHYVEIVSGLFLKGAGLAELWKQTLALIGISGAMFSGGWLLFRRQW
ncbi:MULTISPECIES: ABC transporter permease [unclassified Phenylobacterium]|jgi:ABC-2 type transport system permease protein|uniref:ABC transporter permease n=1 Tax=unclassified Phenylobacterium TaxID=2640670 RepID=UPI00083B886E|nr:MULTISPECIES: ABC transporter permease [unclassified Phenylobacterium]